MTNEQILQTMLASDVERDTKTNNQNHVEQIAKTINEGSTYDEAGMCADDYGCEGDDIISGFDYLEDVYDIRYIIDSQGDFISARILVAFGGPNIWIDFETKTVELYWWGDRATAYFHDDAMDVEGALRELWEMR